jgi:outer membrane receptor protein involved in Fe transport
MGLSIGPPHLQANVMPAMSVTAARTPETPDRVPASLRLFSGDALQHTPSLTLDGALRSVPGFSLFRRSDSFTANPTAQGVSLRGLGPSGASRSLVLFDDVPLNDPFGGWIAWTKLPRETASHAEVVPGGGATAWGNAALGGAIQIFSAPLKTELIIIDQPPAAIAWGSRGTGRLTLLAGDYGTRSGELAVTRPAGDGIVQLLGRDFRTEGFSLVAPERRGAIDVPAWSRHRWLTGRWRAPLGKQAEFTVTARSYEELRGNGTPYQRNGSREKFLSLAASSRDTQDFFWSGVAYVQDQSFASTFSSVNATRTAETPASDQFAVPATALGAAWSGTWIHRSGARTSGGVDARYARGETRENFTFTGGNFTRQRIAGGQQLFSGMFVHHQLLLAEGWRATLGARVDSWRDTDGHRRETDRTTGAVLRDDRYADRSDIELNPSAGLVWTPTKTWRVRANAQQSFRRPTLNELYRPFRQGANVTETNPALRTEHATSAELGAEWSLFGVAPAPTAAERLSNFRAPTPPRVLTLGATAYWNQLRDAVGNVTLARGPGTFPLFGTLATGGVGRQRLNLDRTRVRGVELTAMWRPAATLSFSGELLFNDATVTRAAIAPALVGKRLAQVPRRSASLSVNWDAPAKLRFAPRVRWIGRQFEDDENQLILGEVVVVDFGVSRALGKYLEAFVNVENLTDARVETGRSADGVVNIGTPRLATIGLRAAW